MADFQPSSLGSEDSREKRLQEIKRKTEREKKTGILTQYIFKSHSKSLTNSENVKRNTIGETNNNKPQKTILMVGETGTGKSTLINAMVNYMLGVEFKDRIWCEIIETKEDQTKSQTKAVTVYDVFVEESPFSLTVIDTPGFGSTEGIEKDFKVAEALHDLFKSEEVHGIDLVCLVVSAANTRLTQTQRYVFDAILSLFGKDVENNIVVLITRSPNKPRDALEAIKASKVKCAKNGEEPVYFRFALSHCEAMREKYADEEYDEEFRSPWDVTQKNMKIFFAHLEKAETVDVEKTQTVLKNRKQLISCIQNLDDRIKEKEMKKNELEETKAALEKHEREKRDNNNFVEYEISESYKVKVPIEYSWWHWTKQATCCTECEENCHYPGCWWVSSLSRCSVMSEGKCTVCTGKCDYTKHVKENKIYKTETRKVKKTYEDLKKKYEKGVGEKQSAVKYLEREIKEQEQEKTRLVEESYQCVVTLQDIALNTDAVSTLLHLDFLIEKVKETNSMEKVQKLQDIKKRAEATCKGLVGFVSLALSSGRLKM